MGAPGQQRAFDERQPIPACERAIDGFGDFGTGRRTFKQFDLLALFVAAQIVFNQTLGRFGCAVDDAQVFFLQFMMLNLDRKSVV